MEPQDNKLLDSSKRRINRKWTPNYVKDFDELISDLDHKTVVSGSRKLYGNCGWVRGVIDYKSTLTVGQAFLPQFQGINKDWKKQAGDWLAQWYRVADVRGFNVQTILFLVSLAVDIDGDAFVLLTEAKSGYPQIQLIPAHQVGQRADEKRVLSGPYAGQKIRKGVIMNKAGRAIAYRVLGETEADDTEISAFDLIHVYDPQHIDQSRGLPLMSHAINTFKDMASGNEKHLMALELIASLAFIENNETGGPDDFDLNVSTDGRPTSETFHDEGGTTKFFRSGSDSKLEVVESNRPGADYESFQKWLLKESLVGANWPSVLLDLASGNGTADRIGLRMAERVIADRQALLFPVILRMVTYALSKAIKLELLPFDPDFFRWNFSTPAALSIDAGRDSAAMQNEYKLGIRNLTDILSEEGKTLDEHLYERATEEARAILIRQEIEAAYGVTIDPQAMRLGTTSQPAPHP